MNKPNNWDNTTTYGDFEPLELGGHVCKIMKVEETKSRGGKDMIVISLDIAEGDQEGYYANQYRNDKRDNKKWGCMVYQLVEDNEGNTNRGFKTFIDAVAKSNIGFDPNKIWDDKFALYFKDKLIGGVFGREQYINRNGELKWSTKCMHFRDVDTVREGVAVPEDKYLPENKPQQRKTEFDSSSIYDDDGDLPF